MQEGAASESSPRNTYVVQGLSMSPFLESLLADGKQLPPFFMPLFTVVRGETVRKGVRQPSKRGFRRCGDAKMGLKVRFRWSIRLQHRGLFRPFRTVSEGEFSEVQIHYPV